MGLAACRGTECPLLIPAGSTRPPNAGVPGLRPRTSVVSGLLETRPLSRGAAGE